jgi:L-lactate dehydrogenase complex protein LldG
MKESTSKEKVLKKIREALINRTRPPYESVDMEANVFKQGDSLFADVNFAEAFSQVGGKFVFCSNVNELAQNITGILVEKKTQVVFCPDSGLKKLILDERIEVFDDEKSLENCQVSITGCEALVGRLGTIVASSRQLGGRKGYILPDCHFVIAHSGQIVNEIAEAFQYIKKNNDGELPSMITFITGPSRTADIEKKLVMGAHGPKELFLFLLDQ